ncbi:hypothetical protein M8J77_013073 [Diaphorina citri]|nr:hypothetical protein M8J77_013073 [Diaphorina citri]
MSTPQLERTVTAESAEDLSFKIEDRSRTLLNISPKTPFNNNITLLVQPTRVADAKVKATPKVLGSRLPPGNTDNTIGDAFSKALETSKQQSSFMLTFSLNTDNTIADVFSKALETSKQQSSFMLTFSLSYPSQFAQESRGRMILRRTLNTTYTESNKDTTPLCKIRKAHQGIPQILSCMINHASAALQKLPIFSNQTPKQCEQVIDQGFQRKVISSDLQMMIYVSRPPRT